MKIINIIDVLELIKLKIESLNPVEDRFLRSKGNDNGFEKLFPIIVDEVIKELNQEHELVIKIHSGHHFPDADLFLNGIKYGVELKSRNNGSWSTNGNSVLESITGDGYEEIYILFGSKVPNENRLLVRYAPYWQVTTNIKVTHSPRFTINMNADVSVFDNKEEYDTLRSKNEEYKIKFLQDYLREESIGYGAKWYVADNEHVHPNKFSDLPNKIKNQLRIEFSILFIDDLMLGSDKIKYTRVAEYMLETYFVYNKSVRDLFSAGGSYYIKGVRFHHIIGELISNRELLIETLNNASPDFVEFAQKSWSKNLPLSLITDNLYNSYENILNYIGTKHPYKDKLKELGINKLSNLIF